MGRGGVGWEQMGAGMGMSRPTRPWGAGSSQVRHAQCGPSVPPAQPESPSAA